MKTRKYLKMERHLFKNTPKLKTNVKIFSKISSFKNQLMEEPSIESTMLDKGNND